MLVPMKRLTLIGLAQDESQVFKALEGTGAIEIIPVEHAGDRGAPTPADKALDRLDRSIDFLSKYSKKKPRPAPVEEPAVGELFEDNDEALALCAQVEALEEKMAAITAAQESNSALIEQLAPWSAFTIPLEAMRPTATVEFFLGTASDAVLEELFALGQSEPIAIECLHIATDANAVFIACHKSFLGKLGKLLTEGEWVPADFSQLSGTPDEAILSLHAENERLQKKYASVNETALALSARIGELGQARDAFAIEAHRLQIRLAVGKTARTFRLEGWVRACDEALVRSAIADVSEFCILAFRDPTEDETPPSAAQNRKLISPFEVITNMYAAPKPGALDPTPLMAPFFFLFFGLMVADACYGFLLTLLGFLFIWLARPQGNVLKVAKTIAYGGIAAVLWGVLFGRYFALGAPALPWLPPPLLFDPLKNPVNMLLVCGALGYVHISLGIWVNICAAIKKKDFIAAIFDNFCWFVIITGVAVLAAGPLAGVSVWAAACPVIAAALGVVLFSKRQCKNWVKRIALGFAALRGILAYVADLLSYVRVFALCIVTGVFGYIANTLAGMIMHSALGIILGVVLLIAAHALTIAISAFGAFVHGARLQVVEFYGKFYTGDGREFKPFTRRTGYIKTTPQ